MAENGSTTKLTVHRADRTTRWCESQSRLGDIPFSPPLRRESFPVYRYSDENPVCHCSVSSADAESHTKCRTPAPSDDRFACREIESRRMINWTGDKPKYPA